MTRNDTADRVLDLAKAAMLVGATILVLLWVGLMLALLLPVAAIDWLHQRIRRKKATPTPGKEGLRG